MKPGRVGWQRFMVALAVIAGLCMVWSPTPGTAQHQHGPAASPPAAGTSWRLGDLTIVSPWSRATPQGAPVAAGYLVIHNTGHDADRLVSAVFAGAGSVEIHETSEENGIARMRRVEPGLVIPPGGMVELKPGGYHLMLLRLERGLAAGEKRQAALAFEKAGAITVEFDVRPAGAGAGATHKGH